MHVHFVCWKVCQPQIKIAIKEIYNLTDRHEVRKCIFLDTFVGIFIARCHRTRKCFNNFMHVGTSGI